MNFPTRIHPAGCGCEDCHRSGQSVPLDLADESAIARVLAGQAANDSGRALVVSTTTAVAPGEATASSAARVVVECDGRTWDVSCHLMAVTSFHPPF
ncbi:hypothetical protein [Streptomyces sp. NRRL B-24484]|uniref:hypothetical protein n=1 Tax=Streptomyces sp. NRRL B-24484 TaxID=1463833 RepID=UPI0004BE871C|nr:hypothetical protein [Streptomyces sp. NRRL B-24484]